MAIPPLDQITKLPATGVNSIQQQFNKLIEQTLDASREVITESTKLPQSIKCDDPRIKNMKVNLEQVTAGIQKVQETIPQVQGIINTVKTVITTAQTIKSAIAAAQLSNPVTAPIYIAAQADALQNELIENAVAAIIPLQAIPLQALSKLETLVPPLIAAVEKLNRVCDGDIELDIPSLSDVDGISDIDGYNDVVPTEFYREENVSDSDLVHRGNTIQQLVQEQQDLLTSLQEAPSQVYKQSGPPPAGLGKPGDYYIDIQTNTPYGPKKSKDSWVGPIN